MTTAAAINRQAGPALSGGEILDNARALAARVREKDLAAEYDRLRQLPADIVDEIRAGGILRMNMPEIWGAARSYVFTSLETQWGKLERGEALSDEDRANAWLSRTNAFQAGRRVVSLLYDTIGGSAIYAKKSPFDRHLRDTQTLCQHVVAQTKGWEGVGALLLGGDGDHPLL